VTLLNTDTSVPFKISAGDRIAQMLFQKVEQAKFIEVETLPGSDRGENGFGSSGVK
jgi:dUTP pyrophosphatase